MPTRLVNVVVDAADGSALGRFRSELLGWPIAVDTPDEVDVRCPDVGELVFDLVFAPVTDPKVVKNPASPSRTRSTCWWHAVRARRTSASGTCRGWSCRTRRATSSVS
jgi:hypothetical protein